MGGPALSVVLTRSGVARAREILDRRAANFISFTTKMCSKQFSDNPRTRLRATVTASQPSAAHAAGRIRG